MIQEASRRKAVTPGGHRRRHVTRNALSDLLSTLPNPCIGGADRVHQLRDYYCIALTTSERQQSTCIHARHHDFGHLATALNLGNLRRQAGPRSAHIAIVQLCFPRTRNVSELLGPIRARSCNLDRHVSSEQFCPSARIINDPGPVLDCLNVLILVLTARASV